METKPEIQVCNVVLVGDFNPKIFQPAWFALESIIGKSEADNAEIKVIHPDIVVFRIDWFDLQVTRDRFIITTAQEAYNEPLRDLVISTFKLLHHTPIHMLGINFDFHYSLNNFEALNNIFNTIVHLRKWESIFDKPHFLSISIEDSPRDDGNKGYYRVKIEPSIKVTNGIYLSCNDHYEISNMKEYHGTKEIIDILSNNWRKSHDKSKSIVDKIKGTQ